MPIYEEFDAGDEELGDHPIRPYVRTRGRTRATHDLRPDSLLVGIAAVLPDEVGRQERGVLACVRGVTSLAELAAYMRLPASVVAVIVSDMIDAGFIGLRPGLTGELGPDRETLEKVLMALDNL
ncbi:MAG: DUF742 domain-containing protein [Nocardioides sp.]|nr:DUF742 domain-containing protein [Nocardioides sp.]